MSRAVVTIACAWFLVSTSAPGSAQVLGLFQWQMQPYCNLVTFTVIQQGPTYQLTGNDNLCGAPVFAPATGTASPNTNGTVSLGFQIVLPSGATAHVSATVNLANVSGTWTDADGNTGPFVFNPPAVGGSPRPNPTRSVLITSTQLAASIFAGTGAATTIARSDHTHDDRYFTEAESHAVVAAAGAEIAESNGEVPTDLTHEAVFHVHTVTTAKTGRLLILFPVNIMSLLCSGGSYYGFLTLDGTPIPNSVTRSSSGDGLAHLTGVTTTAVPAGSHLIRAGTRCSGGSYSGATFNTATRVSVVVLP